MDFKLIDVNSDSRLQRALEIYQSNSKYFSMFSKTPPNVETIKEDMLKKPPTSNPQSKNYKLISYDSTIIGILDFISDYPDSDTMYIGLLLIDTKYQSQGYGNLVLKRFEEYAKKLGYLYIELSVVEYNSNAMSFWMKLNFETLEYREASIGEKKKVQVVTMRKRL